MMESHFSEQEIQRFADKGIVDMQSTQHLEGCQHCQLRLDNYKSLFSAIQELDSPAFDFDLTAVILDQLPAAKPQYAWLPALATCLSVIFGATMAWVYGPIMRELIMGMSQIWLLTIVCPAILVAAFQGFAQYQDYNKKISVINLQDFAT